MELAPYLMPLTKISLIHMRQRDRNSLGNVFGVILIDSVLTKGVTC
jgi:hypothetical protein